MSTPTPLTESFIRVIGPRDKRDKEAINCCSVSDNWSQGLSPFRLGPVQINFRIAQIMENVWQYGKVYSVHWDKKNQLPNKAWQKWSADGYRNHNPVRYPMGKGAKPLGFWMGKFESGHLLDYIDARIYVYWKLYRNAVRDTESFLILQNKVNEARLAGRDHITLWDFDGYDRKYSTLRGVAFNPDKKMGHAFVLAAMLVYGVNIRAEDLP